MSLFDKLNLSRKLRINIIPYLEVVTTVCKKYLSENAIKDRLKNLALEQKRKFNHPISTTYLGVKGLSVIFRDWISSTLKESAVLAF